LKKHRDLTNENGVIPMVISKIPESAGSPSFIFLKNPLKFHKAVGGRQFFVFSG